MRSVPTRIIRGNISDDVADALRNMIVDGSLPAGERINEVHLSQQLGVSRTPLREALARLAHEGALEAFPRIGYFVRPLTVEEFEQIYTIRPILDPAALRLAGLPSPAQMKRLDEINRRIEKARDADEIIGLDDEWHLELVSACPNKVLVDLIKQFARRTRRYEIALMRERRNVLASITKHKAITSALRKRDLEGACAALRLNCEIGFAPIMKWLVARDAQTAKEMRK
ncbi:MAG TPA: GntR family transcriptional regulator [Gemmatimonadaceae bacterium]|nr:GntR family transcriptional regulator [Gemmatimonadaceae bacterium]